MKPIALLLLLTLLPAAAPIQDWDTLTNKLVSVMGTGAYHPGNHQIYLAEATRNRIVRVSTVTGAIQEVNAGIKQPLHVLISGRDLLVFTAGGELWKISAEPGGKEKIKVVDGLGYPGQPALANANVVYVPGKQGGKGVLWAISLVSKDNPKMRVSQGLTNWTGLLYSNYKRELLHYTNGKGFLEMDRKILRFRQLHRFNNVRYLSWANGTRTLAWGIDDGTLTALDIPRINMFRDRQAPLWSRPVPIDALSVIVGPDPNTLFLIGRTAVYRTSVTRAVPARNRIFDRIGWISLHSLDRGQGTIRNDSSPLVAKGASFGGILRVTFNFEPMRKAGATHYRVLIDNKELADVQSGTFVNYKVVDGTWQRVIVKPDGNGAYPVPGGKEKWLFQDMGFLFHASRLKPGRHKIAVQYQKDGKPISGGSWIHLAIAADYPKTKMNLTFDYGPGKGPIRSQHTFREIKPGHQYDWRPKKTGDFPILFGGYPDYPAHQLPAYHHSFLNCGDWLQDDLYGVSSREIGRLGRRYKWSSNAMVGTMYDPVRIKAGFKLPKMVDVVLSASAASNITNGTEFPYRSMDVMDWKIQFLKGSFFEKK